MYRRNVYERRLFHPFPPLSSVAATFDKRSCRKKRGGKKRSNEAEEEKAPFPPSAPEEKSCEQISSSMNEVVPNQDQHHHRHQPLHCLIPRKASQEGRGAPPSPRSPPPAPSLAWRGEQCCSSSPTMETAEEPSARRKRAMPEGGRKRWRGEAGRANAIRPKTLARVMDKTFLEERGSCSCSSFPSEVNAFASSPPSWLQGGWERGRGRQ